MTARQASTTLWNGTVDGSGDKASAMFSKMDL
jgi:hypothetical protein